MTDDRMALLELVEKSADPDRVWELSAFATGLLMELEASEEAGAALSASPTSLPGVDRSSMFERSLGRAAHRNGYRERAWNTRADRIDLAIPKLRNGRVFRVSSSRGRVRRRR